MKFSKISLLTFTICFLASNSLLEGEGSFKESNYTLDDINVPISEENCTTAIENLKKLFKEAYIYTDIKKKPPNREYFGAVDIIGELSNISVSDRKYYDFFRDIKRILGKIKDGHLGIVAYKSPNGYNLQRMAMCLPFRFHIEGENRTDAKIYISKYAGCFEYFDQSVRDFVEKHNGFHLTEINGKDPFDYIQNINVEFDPFYNKHSTFTRNIKTAHSIGIYLNPLSQEQFSNITFAFSNNDSITLDYYLYYNDKTGAENEEFNNFFEQEMLKQPKEIDRSILDIKEEFDEMKKNLNKKANDEIKWDYSTYDNKIRCRVDYNNSLNVFTQSTFMYAGEHYKEGIAVVDNCTELFYSNDFPIVGIESYNGGGICKLSYYFQELLQVKILPTAHYSTIKSRLMEEYVEADIPDITDDPDMYQRIDIETCEPFKKFADMKEIEDDYGDGVKHKKTQYFRVFNSSDLKEHKKIREKYYAKNNLKRPTDIIIFTDTYSFSATSFFIKGLQETGSAIVVGYFGNPKCDEPMDASQSPSFVGYFPNTEVYSKLKEVGFEIWGVTIYESYNYTYQIPNPIPREYLIHPVDETFDVFEAYSDELYDKFINKAKEVFKKYNEDKQCNPKNLELLYEPINQTDCYTFANDSHAHGGYECDVKTGNWSEKCKPYYCDIGYYFDKYQNKCIKDICTEGKDEDDGKKNSGRIISWSKFKMMLPLLALLC